MIFAKFPTDSNYTWTACVCACTYIVVGGWGDDNTETMDGRIFYLFRTGQASLGLVLVYVTRHRMTHVLWTECVIAKQVVVVEGT